MANIEDLRDRSVSSGTLKSDDLIPKFLDVLKTYGKDKYDKYIKENPEVEDWKNLDEETMGWVVDELTDLLNEIAPDGCYFGASEGDEADFGFWSMSNESKKSEVSSLAEFDIEDVVGKKLGWTWDDDKSCLVDKDGTEVGWDELIDELNAVAPEGTYFGSHPGDGSDFGFWTVDESKKSEGIASDIRAEKPTVYLVSEAGNDYDYDELLDAFEGEQSYVSVETADKSVELPLAFDRDKNLLLILDDELSGDDAAYAKELVQGFVDGKTSVSSKPLTNDYVCIVDGMDYTATCYVPESKQSEGTDDPDKKDDKSCKGKDCKDGKQTENRDKPQEGPGAGYDVTFEDVDVKDVSVTFNEAKDAFDVALKISARMNAEGYDWDTQYYREHMGYEPEDDEITLKFSLPNSSLKQDWADMDMADASIEEKVKALDEAFHSVDLQKFGYGGGYSHSKFNPGRVDNVLVYPFEYDGAYIEPCQSNSSLLEYNTYIPLEMGVQGTFAQDVEGACNYGSDLYDFTEKVRDIVKDLLPEQEISDSDISDERCEDYFTGGWDAEDAANEIADELRDSSESKKSESSQHDAYYAKALQAVDRAIKMTHDQFDITGDVAKFDADLKKYLVSYVDSLNDTRLANIGLLGDLRDRIKDFARGDREEWWKNRKQGESKKSESLTLKQKELKDMARFGQAEDITTISDEEAKALRKKGIETIGVSRGTYGMNGALLRDNEGKKYVITARSSNLFYFV